jgi:arabinofuranosyltransferase
MEKLISLKQKNNIKYVLILINIALLFRIISYAWVTDDAFISFRSVINFVDGYGPVFNVGERVQSYTHPLWFFLLSLGGFLGMNLYYWSISLGIVFSVGLLFLLFRTNELRLNKEVSSNLNYIIILITLFFSESFLSFQTSGLENSATNFFLLLYFFIFFNLNLEKNYNYIFFGLVGSLIILNRLDHAIIILPALMYAFFCNKNALWKRVMFSLFSFLPFILWSCFSIVYYGFLFPNTKYVKVGGISFIGGIRHGLKYLYEFLQSDVHVIVILVTLIICFLLSRISYKKEYFFVLVGIFLQIFYVIMVGGDFMRGRFFVSSIIAIVFLFMNVNFNFKNKYLNVGCIIVFGLFSIFIYKRAFYEEIVKFPGMENERNFYKEYLAMNMAPNKVYSNHPWAKAGQNLDEKYKGQNVTIVGVNGLRGYFCKRNITLIDPVGLTDAFISRLPVIDNSRIGHFVKDIPNEYYDEKISNSKIEHWSNSDYQSLCENIKVVTQSEYLFTMKRFKSMLWVWKRYGI